VRAQLREPANDHDHWYRGKWCGVQRHRKATVDVTRPVDLNRNERGASLILALVFITCLGFMAGVSLNVAESTFRDDQASQSFRSDVYGGGGAIDVYINAMRSTATWGREGSACPDLTMTLVDGRTVTVNCVPVNGSGALIVGGAGARSNRIVDLYATIANRRVASARPEFVDGGGSSIGSSVRIRHWITAA